MLAVEVLWTLLQSVYGPIPLRKRNYLRWPLLHMHYDFSPDRPDTHFSYTYMCTILGGKWLLVIRANEEII